MDRAEIAQMLWARSGKLLMIFDCAQTGGAPKGIVELLREAGKLGATEPAAAPRSQDQPEAVSLYENEDPAMREIAPMLVRFGNRRDLLERVVQDGWGRARCLFLTADASFSEVAAHLRGFIKVRTEEGEMMYFRYYDPRVLRVFLPGCTPAERAEFFGKVREFLLEAEDAGNVLLFRNDGSTDGQIVETAKGPKSTGRGMTPHPMKK